MFFVRFAVLLVAVGACSGVLDPGDSGIGGHYALSTIDGQTLPCCAQVDSTGARVTIVSGELTLKATLPEAFVFTPAGYYPERCVGTGPLGRCGDADYTLTITKRFDDPGGSSHEAATTSTGLYAWSSHDPAMVKLVDARMGGEIQSGGDDIKLFLQNMNVMGFSGPTYLFEK